MTLKIMTHTVFNERERERENTKSVLLNRFERHLVEERETEI